MGHGRGKSSTSYEKPTVPVADYNVTGTLTPDATCNYFLAGIHDGKNYHSRGDGAYFIYWQASTLNWIISDSVTEPTLLWLRNDPNIEGEYLPAFETIGIATVSAGPH